MTKDLTNGRIAPLLIKFTIPLILGNLFQLTYNAADSVIVGHFVGSKALAAVGICNPIMTLLILFLNGLCMGAGILMGTQYGAGRLDMLYRQISTTMLSGVAFSCILSLLCILISDPILYLMQVDAAIITLTGQYLRIILTGLVFTFLYNFFSSTLRALGDSNTPLYFLILSSLLNIAGDVFFVAVLNMGSRGCAISTVISEALCCVFCIIYIQNKVGILRLGRKWLVFDVSVLKQTISYGWASAMQQATVQLGKIGIQVIVNTMGISAAAAFAVVNRIDDFAYTPEQNIAHAMTSFMAQNKGAGKNDRVQKGFRDGMYIEIAYGIFIFLVCFVFARPLMGMFVDDETVISLGVRYLKLISIMYLLPAFTNGIQGFFRGIGDLKVTLLSSFINMGVRLLAALIMVYMLKMQIEAIPYSYLAGWAGMLICETPLLVRKFKQMNTKNKII